MMSSEHCAGCRDDFYNGKNGLGIKACWSLKDAKLVLRKRVHISQVPPWDQPAEQLPNCYHAAQFIFVDPGRNR